MTDSQDNSESVPVSRLAGKWQAPAFLFSVVVFALAAGHFVTHRPKPSWDSRFAAVQQLMQNAVDGNYSEADHAAQELQTDTPATDGDKLARICERRAEIRWLSIQHTQDRSPAQLEALVRFYDLTAANGLSLSAEQLTRMGGAYEGLGQSDQAEGMYRQAIALDAARTGALLRRIIELPRSGVSSGDRLAMLEEYQKLGPAQLDAEQYGWAVGRICDTLAADGRQKDAMGRLEELAVTAGEPSFVCHVKFHKARLLARQAETSQDPEQLRTQADDLLIELAADLQATDHLYPQANLLRGGLVCHDNPDEALRAFEVVIERAPASDLAAAARHGLGLAYQQLGQPQRALEQFGRAAEELAARPGNTYLTAKQIRQSLSDGGLAMLEGNQPELALQFVRLEQRVIEAEQPPVPVAEQLALLYRLGEAHLAAAMNARNRRHSAGPLTDAAIVEQLAHAEREDLRSAAEIFRRRADLARKDFDDIYGESLWLAADAYDQAAMRDEGIAAFREFVDSRPSDPRIREGLFRLGQACQADGRFDAAIDAYQRNLDLSKDGRHVMASAGLIPMAMCHVAKGPDSYDQAEKILQSIIDNELVFTPDSEIYREALFALGKLCHERKQWSPAVAWLGEAVQRDPGKPIPRDQGDPAGQRRKYIRATHSFFLLAECYRRSALELSESAKAEPNPLHRDQRLREVRDRLTQADLTYAQVIARLEALDGPLSELDQAHRRNSYFARGDCLYALEDYVQAVERYEQAVFLFQTDPAVLGGLMQIYNCNVQRGRMDYARAAQERARVLLAGFEPARLKDPGLQLSGDSWQWWLDGLSKLDPDPSAKEDP